MTVLTPEQEALVEQLLQIPGVMINEVKPNYRPGAAAHLTGYLGRSPPMSSRKEG